MSFCWRADDAGDPDQYCKETLHFCAISAGVGGGGESMLTSGLPLFHLSPNVENKTVARQDLTKESKDLTYYN